MYKIFCADGSVHCYDLDGFPHCETGPSVMLADGRRMWHHNGQLHRLDGPAWINPCTGIQHWFRYGLRHRADGPATIIGSMEEYYYNGEHIKCSDVEHFQRLIRLRAFW